MKLNNEILKQMKKIYYQKGVEYIDWMGYKITNENKPSYHHIIKSEQLKKDNMETIATLDNGAYLGKKSHEILHKIELIDNDLYDIWNKVFILINKTKTYPDNNILEMIYNLKEKTEKVLKFDNRNR